MANHRSGKDDEAKFSDELTREAQDTFYALRKAQKRLELIYRNTSVSTWDYNIKTRQIIHSGNSQKIHGFHPVIDNVPEALIASGFVHPDSAEAYCAMYDKLFAGEPYVEGIFRVQTADRTGYWYEHIRYTTIFDEHDRPDIAIGISTDVTREMALKQKADADSLTGFLNHGAFLKQTDELLQMRTTEKAFLLLMDLDRFKQINDNYGHMAGDQALTRFSTLLSTALRDKGLQALCGRVGGDEFAMLLIDVDLAKVEGLVTYVIAQTAVRDEGVVPLSVSIGIAAYPEDADNLTQLYLYADRALYAIKKNTKVRYCFYNMRKDEERRESERRRFFADTNAGGMIGCYTEQGFPLYFIDEGLLTWLGYDTEEEYFRDIGGLTINGVHPDDRTYVTHEAAHALAADRRYTLEYRMRKKDGSYIWVRNICEATTASDGRAAITSVCQDISKEKEHHSLLDNLLADLDASVALYRVEENTVLTLLHASEGVMRTLHYTDEEYRAICKDDAMDFVYVPDRKMVRKAIERTVTDNIVVTEHFRMYNKKGGVAWTTARMSRHATDHNRPVLRIIFMPISIQNDLQLQMLDSPYISVYVIDAETDELYFANNTALELYHVREVGVAGKACYKTFYNTDNPCEHCWRHLIHGSGTAIWENGGRVYNVEVQKREWNKRSVLIVYGRDITEQYHLERRRKELLDNIPAGISLFSIKDHVITPLYISESVHRSIGIDVEAMMNNGDGQALFDCVHPDDFPTLWQKLSTDVKTPQRDCFYRYRVWSGTKQDYIWVELHANYIRQDDTMLMYATYSDMTRVNRTRQQLEQRQQALEAVVHYGHIGIWQYNLDTGECTVDYTDVSALGYQLMMTNLPDSIVEQKLVHPDDADTFVACYNKVRAGAAVSDCTVRMFYPATDTYYWLHVYLVRQKDTADGTHYALGFALMVDNEVRSAVEARENQQKLQQSQEMLEAACSFAGLYSIVYDTDTKAAFMDEFSGQAFGIATEIENLPALIESTASVSQEEKQQILQALAQLESSTEETVLEHQWRINGEMHWIRFQGRLLSTKGQEHRKALITAQIIDTEKQMQARWETTKQNIRTVGNATLLYFAGNLSRNAVVEYKPPFADATTTFAEDWDALMAGIDRFMDGEEAQRYFAQLHDAANLQDKFRSGFTHHEFQSRMVLADGKTYWTRHVLSLLQDPATGNIYLYEYVFDAGRERLMDALLRYETNRGCGAVGLLSADDGQFMVLELDADGECKTTQVTMPFSQFIRHFADTVVAPEDRERYLHHYLSEGHNAKTSSYADLVYKGVRNGTTEYLNDSVYSFEEEGKSFFVLAQRKVTELIRAEEEKSKHLEEALTKAEKANRAKTDFLSRMSHDMRTPLNAILGMTQLAKEEAQKGQSVAEYFEQIQQSGQYLLGVINDILEMGRIESGKTTLSPAWYPTKELLLPVIHMIRPLMDKKEIHFDFDEKTLSRWNMELFVDRQKTQQMFMNILNNACKFTPEGGTVSLRFNNVSLDRKNCIAVDKIVIADTGCGMSEEFMQHIFRPFEQERLPGAENIPGSGLGLSIARNIAQSMGGDITVQSTLGKGSTFTIIYPYHYRVMPHEHSSHNADVQQNEAKRLVDKKVLLVEDNDINAMIATKLLKNKGMEVLLAKNGQEGVNLFAQFPAYTFDLILMDIRMPVMDGLEATRRIRQMAREDAKSIPIIAMSANAFDEDRHRSIATGMNDHLTKPVDPNILYQTILHYLR